MKIPFEVIDRHARTIGGEPVRDGIVSLSDEQAEHYLRMGAIRCMSAVFAPADPAPTTRHPLDHDGDGRPGGSLPKRKRGRKPRATAETTGEPPTNPPPRDDGEPPMPFYVADRETKPWEE